MASSRNFHADEEEYDDVRRSGVLPSRTEDRASTNLRSPAFQQAAEEPEPDIPEPTVAPSTPVLPPSVTLAPLAPSKVTPPRQLAPEPAPTLHRRYADDRTEAAVQQRDTQTDLKNQAGYDSYLQANGIEFDVQPDGRKTVSTHEDGAFRYKEDVSDPVQNQSGRWVKQHRNARGETREIDLIATGQYKLDRDTGTRFITSKTGEAIPIGVDDSYLESRKLKEQRSRLAQENAADQLAMSEEKAAHDDGVAELDTFRSQAIEVGGFGETVKDVENRLLNREEGEDPEYRAQSEKALAEWNAKTPVYGQLREGIAKSKASLEQRENRIRDRRARSLLLANSNQNAEVEALLPASLRRSAGSLGEGDADLDDVEQDSAALSATEGASNVTSLQRTLAKFRENGFVTVAGQPIEEAHKEVVEAVKEERRISTVRNVAESIGRGALSEGVFAGIEGIGLILANAAGKLFGPDSGAADNLQRYSDETAEVRQNIRDAMPGAGDFPKSLPSQIFEGIGQAVATLPLYVIPGVGKALGPLHSIGQIYAEGFNDALSKSGDLETAHRAAVKYLPAAAMEVAADKLIIGKILKPLKGKMSVGQLLTQIGTMAGFEGATEGAQQLWLNTVAKHLEGYDPDRPLDQEVINSFVVGTLVGGTVTAAGSLAANRLTQEGGEENPSGEGAVPSPPPIPPTARYNSKLADLDDTRGKLATAIDAGDIVEEAKLKDRGAKIQREIHGLAEESKRAIPDAQRTALGKLIDPQLDVAANESAFAQDVTSSFASAEIGRQVRAAYLKPEREATIANYAQTNNLPESVAQTVVDQHLGMMAIADIKTVLTGGTIEATKADMLVGMNLLQPVTGPDGAVTLAVTDDALPLLPKGVRKQVAMGVEGMNIVETPGRPSDGLATLIRAGQRRFADAFAAVPPIDTESNGTKTYNVTAQFKTRTGEDRTAVMSVDANSHPEAVAKGAKRVEKAAAQVLDVKAELEDDLDMTPVDSKNQPIRKAAPFTFEIIEDIGKIPEPSKEALKVVRREFGKNTKLMQALGVQKIVVAKFGNDSTSGLVVTDGVMLVDPSQIATQFTALASASKEALWTQEAFTEEAIHLAQFAAEGRNFTATYTEVRQTAPAELVEATREAYHGFDELTEAAQGAEIARMVIQRRWKGTITEQVFKAIENVLAYLRGLNIDSSPVLRDAIARTEAVLKSAEAAVINPAKSGVSAAKSAKIAGDQTALKQSPEADTTGPNGAVNGSATPVPAPMGPESQVTNPTSAVNSTDGLSTDSIPTDSEGRAGIAGDAGTVPIGEPSPEGDERAASVSEGEAPGTDAVLGERGGRAKGRSGKAGDGKARNPAKLDALAILPLTELETAITDKKVTDGMLVDLHARLRGKKRAVIEAEMLRRSREEQLAEANETLQSGGADVLDWIIKRGGIQISTTNEVGEVARLRENPKARRPGLFTKAGASLDQLRNDAVSRGYRMPNGRQIETVNDMLEMLEARLNGAKNFPVIASLEDDARIHGFLGAAPVALKAGNATILEEGIHVLAAAKAYHGTRHKVDRFSLEKIGIGEGAQVFGHGLYFAQNRAVAESYRGAGGSDTANPTSKARILIAMHGEERAARLAQDQVESAQGDLDFYRLDPSAPKVDSEYMDSLWRQVRYAVEVRRIIGTPASRRPTIGNVYTVEIDVADDSLLDWDLPLSEQSAQVKALVSRYETEDYNIWDGSGEGFYRMLTDQEGSPQDASNYLLEAGIQGIKFLDQGSRFVPNDKMEVRLTDGGWAVFDNGQRVLTYRSEAEARAAIAKEAKPQTSNFVIFDDSLIRITGENGNPVTLDEAREGEQESRVQEFLAAAKARDTSADMFAGTTGDPFNLVSETTAERQARELREDSERRKSEAEQSARDKAESDALQDPLFAARAENEGLPDEEVNATRAVMPQDDAAGRQNADASNLTSREVIAKIPSYWDLFTNGKSGFTINGVPFAAEVSSVDEIKGLSIMELLIENIRTGYGEMQDAFGVTGTMGVSGARQFMKEAQLRALALVKSLPGMAANAVMVRSADETRTRLYGRIFSQINGMFPGFVATKTDGSETVFVYFKPSSELAERAEIARENGFDVRFHHPDSRASSGDVLAAAKADPLQRSMDFGVNSQPNELPLDRQAVVPSGRRALEPNGPALSANELLQQNMGLAVTIANRYRNIPGVEFDDILSNARLALARAARAFDPEMTTRFSSYAGNAIENQLRTLYGAEKRYADRQSVTLDEPAGEDSTSTKADLIEGSTGASVSSGIEQAETSAMLQSVVGTLSGKAKQVVEMLIEGVRPNDIADRLGVTKQTVSKLKIIAAERMQAALKERGISGVDADGVLYAAKAEPPAKPPTDTTGWTAVKTEAAQGKWVVRDKLGNIQASVLPTFTTAELAIKEAARAMDARSAAPATFGPVIKWSPLRLFLGTADVLERTKGLEPLAAAIRKHVDRARKLGADMANPYRKWEKKHARKVRKTAMSEFEAFQSANDTDRKDDATRAYSLASPAGKELINLWRASATKADAMNRAAALEVYDEKTKSYRSIGSVTDYFPRSIKPEILELIQNPTSNQKLWEEVVGSLIEGGQINDREEAYEFLSRSFQSEKSFDYMGHIEAARQLKLPNKMYDYTFAASRRYLMSWSERMAQIEAYGQVTKENPKDLFDTTADGTLNKGTAEYIKAVQARAYGTNPNNLWARIASALNLVATATMLGNPVTVGINLMSGTAYNAATMGLVPALKGAWEMRNGFKAIEDAYEKGILQDDLMSMMQDVDTLGSPFMKKLAEGTGKVLKWTGYNASEEFVRGHGLLTAKAFLRSAIKAHKKNPQSRASETYRDFFKRNGINPSALLAEDGAGTLTDTYLRSVINAAQGGYRFDQVPVFVDTALGKFIFKYQKWGTQAARNFELNVYQPLLKGRVAPLVTYLAVAGAVGASIDELKELLFGMPKRDADWDEIGKTLSEDTKRGLAMAAGKAMNHMLSAGAVGIIGNYFQSLRDVAERSRFKNPMDPPGLAIIKNSWELTMRLKEQGTLTARDFDDFARSQIGLYRTVESAGAKAANAAGADFKWQKLEKRRQDLQWLNVQTRRFAKEIGVEASRTSLGRVAKTPDSPFQRKLSESLMIGDTQTARETLTKHLAQYKDPRDRKAELRSIQASVRAKQPVRVGAAGEARRALFLDWAKGKLDGADLERVKQLDSTYRQSARLLGLMSAGKPLSRSDRDEALAKMTYRSREREA